MYCRLYLGVEADAFGGKIIFSGLLNGGALVLLLWIYFFTASHETQERQLSELLAAAGMSADTVVETAEPVTVTQVESEF